MLKKKKKKIDSVQGSGKNSLQENNLQDDSLQDDSMQDLEMAVYKMTVCKRLRYSLQDDSLQGSNMVQFVRDRLAVCKTWV